MEIYSGPGSVVFEDLEDEELLVLSRRRPDAFGAFYERHAEAVLRFFARRTRTPDETPAPVRIAM